MSRKTFPFVIEAPGELRLSSAEIEELKRALKDEVVNVLEARPDDTITSDETNINNAVVVTSRVQRGRARKSPAKKGRKSGKK